VALRLFRVEVVAGFRLFARRRSMRRLRLSLATPLVSLAVVMTRVRAVRGLVAGGVVRAVVARGIPAGAVASAAVAAVLAAVPGIPGILAAVAAGAAVAAVAVAETRLAEGRL